MFSRTLHAQHPVTTNLNTSPRFSPTIFYRDANSVPTINILAHLYTRYSSSINRLYAQNPVFKIIHGESVIVYLHMYSGGNVQQNPLFVESCFTKEYSISPGSRQRCLIPMQIQYSYKYYTSTPSYSCINRLYAQNPVFEIVREESVKVYLHMYSGNVQQNPLCVESCFTKEYSIFPGSRQRCLIPMQIQYSYEHTFVQQ